MAKLDTGSLQKQLRPVLAVLALLVAAWMAWSGWQLLAGNRLVEDTRQARQHF